LNTFNPTNFIGTVPCTTIVLTAGVWTPRLFKTLFPHSKVTIPVSALGGHSLLYTQRNYSEPETCYAVFSTDVEGFSPEAFSRKGNELFVAGLNSSTLSIPDIASDVYPIPESIACLKKAVAQIIKGDGIDLVRESLVCLTCTLENLLSNVIDSIL
jgi:FAD dependent oxidoreductase